jgi:hypothetical protein
MSTITLNHQVSDGSILLLTEKTKTHRPIFQFWYDGIKEPELSEHQERRSGAKIEIQFSTDENLPFVSIMPENIVSLKNQNITGSKHDIDFHIHPDFETGLIELSVPKGIYLRFILNPHHATKGTVTAANLLNDEFFPTIEQVEGVH